jgi:hypothetical protein
VQAEQSKFRTARKKNRGAMMASNPVAVSGISTTDQWKQMLKTVSEAAQFIEQILEAAGVGGVDAQVAEQVTTAFSNLASVAIQAAHDAAGKPITPDSVMALMPVTTPLTSPQ